MKRANLTRFLDMDRHCMNCFYIVIMYNCPVCQLVHLITAYYPVSNSYPHTNFL